MQILSSAKKIHFENEGRKLIPFLQTRTSRAAASTTLTESQLADLVGGIVHTLALGGDLAGRAAERGRHVHDGVVGEEVAGSQEQGDGLGGHDGEVLRGGDVGDTEGMPEYDVGVVDGGLAITDPLGETGGGFTRGLGDVTTSGPELIITI